MKNIVLITACLCLGTALHGQGLRTKNLIIVTLDGMRWQEIFQGADSAILYNENYTKDKNAPHRFWSPSTLTRRETLLPFFWNVIATQGQLYGNRSYKNEVNCANPHWFSYPGYSEMLTGFVDRRVKSNHKIENPNATVLEFIHQQPGFENKVAAFATWDVFPYILRENKSGVPVNAGRELTSMETSGKENILNELQSFIPNVHRSKHDAFTFYYAFDFLKCNRPRVMFISFDETDHHSHGGRYDEYLESANRTDEMLAKLWAWVQSEPGYKDQTTLLITTDHGRGRGHHRGWTDHGRLTFGSGQVWFAVIGPDTPPLGEMKNEARYFLKQIAKTSTSFLGLEYNNIKPVGETIYPMIAKKESYAASSLEK